MLRAVREGQHGMSEDAMEGGSRLLPGLMDEDGHQSGAETDGMSTGESGYDESDYSDFAESMDPAAMLREVEQQQTAVEPYQMFTLRRRSRRARRRQAEGSDQEMISDSELAAEVQGDEGRIAARDAALGDGMHLDQWRARAGVGKSRSRSRRRAEKRDQHAREVAASREVPERAKEAIGEANMAYASGAWDEAVVAAKEAIRLAPSLPDGYNVMGAVLKARGEGERSIDVRLIAAHLRDKDLSNWRALLADALDHGSTTQALFILREIVKRDRADYRARVQRAELLCESGQPSRAVREYRKVMALFPHTPEAPLYLARLLYQEGKATDAIQVLESFAHHHDDKCTLEHINCLAELYLEEKHPRQCAQLVAAAAGHDMCGEGGLPLELVALGGMALGAVGDEEGAAGYLQQLLLVDDPNDYGDLFCKVGDAFQNRGEWASAALFFERILEALPHIDSDIVWNLEESYTRLGKPRRTLQMYHDLVHNRPTACAGYTVVHMRYLELLATQDRLADAQARYRQAVAAGNAFRPGEEDTPGRFIAIKGSMLQALGEVDDFMSGPGAAVAQSLDAMEAIQELNTPAEAGMDIKVRQALGRARRRMAARGGGGNRQGPHVIGDRPDRDRRKPHVRDADREAEAWLAREQQRARDLDVAQPQLDALLYDLKQFRVVRGTVGILLARGELGEARDIIARVDGLLKQHVKKPDRNPNICGMIKMMEAEALMAAGEYSTALQKPLRDLCNTWPRSVAVWNLFATATMLAATGSRAKFIAGMREKHPNSLPLMLMSGNCLAAAKSSDAALSEYVKAIHWAPNDPLPWLLAGILLVNKACERRATQQEATRTYTLGLSFFCRYQVMEGGSLASVYNTGRAAHQAGLLHIACEYYDRVLAAPRDPSDSRDRGLRREAAVGLVHIYKGSGNPELARVIMAEHLVV